LVRERPPRLLVRRQRLRLPAGAVEREHLLAPQALAQRIAGDQRLELTDEIAVAPELQIGFDPLFKRMHPELLEPGRLGRRERLRRELGERRAAPQLERRAEALRGLLGATGVEARARRRRDALEAVQVELVRLHLQRVAGRPRVQDAGLERLA